MNPIDHGIDFATLEFRLHTMREQRIAGLVFQIHHTLLRVARYLNVLYVLRFNDLFHECTRLSCKVLQSADIDLVDDKNNWFSSE